jgi:uncharacterized membrane protein YeiH
MPDTFVLPAAVDISAIAFAAASGALLAVRKGYDVIGITALALAAGTGGGVVRDCLLQTGPVALLSNATYVVVAVSSALAVSLLYPIADRIERQLAGWFTVLDAVALALFAVVGMVKAQNAHLAAPAVVLVGMITAVGGGVLRDVLCREEPLLFRPGQFYALAALSGCLAFVGLTATDLLAQGSAGFLCASIILLVRMSSVWFGWRTRQLTKEPPATSGGPTS